jgi:outer membrane protein assembly factor BamB
MLRYPIKFFIRFIANLATCLAFYSAHADGTAKTPGWIVDQLGQHIDTCPAVERDGTIYVTISGNINYGDVSGGKLAAFYASGIKKWGFHTMCEIQSSPALGEDGTIYFGCRDKMLHAINTNGIEKWSFTTGAWVDATPSITKDGLVCFGSWDGKFYALGSDGKKRWEFTTKGPIDSSAAIDAEGTIFFGSHDSNFYALNPDGRLKWKFATQGAVISSPAINESGQIYFTSLDGRLYLLNPDGSEKWHLNTGGVGPSSPVIDSDGYVYLGVNDTFWYVNPNGTKKWWFGYPVTKGSAIVQADGIICYHGSEILFEFDKNGEEKSYTQLDGVGASGSPTISEGTNLIVGDKNLRMFPGSSGLAKSAWPKFHGGLRQTGRVGDN